MKGEKTVEERDFSYREKLIKISERFLELLRKEYNNVIIINRIDDATKTHGK